jgi:hypothetical protein
MWEQGRAAVILLRAANERACEPTRRIAAADAVLSCG